MEESPVSFGGAWKRARQEAIDKAQDIAIMYSSADTSARPDQRVCTTLGELDVLMRIANIPKFDRVPFRLNSYIEDFWQTVRNLLQDIENFQALGK